MNILQKHTAPHTSDNSYLGSYADGKRLPAVNYSTQRKSGMTLLQRVLER